MTIITPARDSTAHALVACIEAIDDKQQSELEVQYYTITEWIENETP